MSTPTTELSVARSMAHGLVRASRSFVVIGVPAGGHAPLAFIHAPHDQDLLAMARAIQSEFPDLLTIRAAIALLGKGAS